MDKLSFKLEVFEGPLDLLLTLIAKNKINIYDIPIASVLDQYMESIEGLEEMDLEQASEFLVMAAYLTYIKSKMLLPQHEDEEEDPRDTLVRMLLEYKRYKQVAAEMGERFAGFPVRAVREPMMPAEEPDLTYDGRHDLNELLAAYRRTVLTAQRKTPPPISEFKGIVNTTYTSISTRVVSILRRLAKGQDMTLKDSFAGAQSRSDVVATFLAVLELISKMRIQVRGEGENARIVLSREKKNG